MPVVLPRNLLPSADEDVVEQEEVPQFPCILRLLDNQSLFCQVALVLSLSTHHYTQ